MGNTSFCFQFIVIIDYFFWGGGEGGLGSSGKEEWNLKFFFEKKRPVECFLPDQHTAHGSTETCRDALSGRVLRGGQDGFRNTW